VQPVSSVHEHAEGQLRVIRAAMERAGAFTAVPGWGGVLMGVVGIVAGVVAGRTHEPREWVLVWLVAAGVAVPVGVAALMHRAQTAGVDLAAGVARRFVLSLATPVAAGVVLSAALLQRESYDLLPTVWLTLYGTGVVLAGVFSIRLITVLGVSFMGLGAAAAFAPWWLATILVVAGFGGLHLLTGSIVLGSDRRSG
jgi:hypothetical protein